MRRPIKFTPLAFSSSRTVHRIADTLVQLRCGLRSLGVDGHQIAIQTGAVHADLDAASGPRRTNHGERASFEELASIALVGVRIMSVTVSDRSDFARTADFELNFLVGMEIWATVCINRFHFDEGKILAVRLERGPIRSDTTTLTRFRFQLERAWKVLRYQPIPSGKYPSPEPLELSLSGLLSMLQSCGRSTTRHEPSANVGISAPPGSPR
jgi:hypothetical protein